MSNATHSYFYSVWQGRLLRRRLKKMYVRYFDLVRIGSLVGMYFWKRVSCRGQYDMSMLHNISFVLTVWKYARALLIRICINKKMSVLFTFTIIILKHKIWYLPKKGEHSCTCTELSRKLKRVKTFHHTRVVGSSVLL